MSTGPTLAGFLAFLRNVAGIAPEYLPDDAPVIVRAYTLSANVVNPALACLPAIGAPGSDPTAPSLYAEAIYNLGADRVINYAPDQTGRTFFHDLRAALTIQLFVPGVTASSSDGGTSQSRLNPEFMKALTIRDLQNLKTPYGQAYLAIAQDYGPSLWGVS